MNTADIIRKLYNNEVLDAEEIIFISKILQNSGLPTEEEIPYRHKLSQASMAIGFKSHTNYVLENIRRNNLLNKMINEKGGRESIPKSEIVEILENHFLNDKLGFRAFILGTLKDD